jgi:hypothetical protein
MKKYRVSLPIDLSGTVYQPGATVELNDETAKLYGHALIALPEQEKGEESADHTNR